MNKAIKLPVLIASACLFGLLLFLPLFPNEQMQQVFALFVLVAALWVTEAMPLGLTGIMIPVAAVLLGLAGPKDAFSQFSHPIIFLFLGGFVLAAALTAHGIDTLLATKLIRVARGNFYRSAILMMLCTAMLAFWISNTSATLMMLPIALGLLALVNKDSINAESKFLLLGIAYSANIGGVVTMVSSPPNAIGATLLRISFLGWLKYSIPLFLITFPLLVFILTLYFKPNKKLPVPRAATPGITGTTRFNATLGAIFLFTIALWLLEGILGPLLGITEGFNAVVAVLAICLIVVTQTLSWEKALKSIQWNILLLFGGGLTLAMLLDSSGLGALLALQISLFATAIPIVAFIWLVIIVSIIFTEFMSNTASAALFLPILYTLSIQLKINPAVLVLPATLAASYGFMLPVGTPPNALVFATGFTPQKEMLKVGAILNMVYSIILTLYFFTVLHWSG